MKAVTVLFAFSVTCFAQGGAPADFFETKIRPVLAANCFSCHTNSKLGGLQLDSRAALLKGGKSGPAITPGKPEESLLIRAVLQQDAKLKMPMGSRLQDQEISDLTSWVRIGAPWPESSTPPQPVSGKKGYVITPEQRSFWAFQPVRRPALPEVRDASSAKSPIDRFIFSQLQKRGLQPARAAEKRDLIRRATFDLIGLPPTPEEIDAFVKDTSPDAFARVVDRLLASPHYGERWGRHWLDLARYADGVLGSTKDVPYPNAYRYRDWVIQAFNQDMPYDQFVKAQLAADLLPGEQREKMLPALGFLSLAPKSDDRVDVTARTFLALTAGCAQCHDHKYDPIPTMDFYSLQGVFESSEYREYPLAPSAVVDAYKKAQLKVTAKKEEIDRFVNQQADQVSDILLAQTSRYMLAAWKVIRGTRPRAAAAAEMHLHAPTLDRWVKYLKEPKEHHYLNAWDQMTAQGGSEHEALKLATVFQTAAMAIVQEKREVDDRNYVKMGGAQGIKNKATRQFTNLEFISPEKSYVWRDLMEEPYTQCGSKFDGGILYYGNHYSYYADKISEYDGMAVVQFLSGMWKEHLNRLLAELEVFEKASPPAYPFVHSYGDSQRVKDIRIAIRGEKDNLGDVAPRRFLQILSKSEAKPFSAGSGRLELAEAIASPENPLTARVMVNRIWQGHFGDGIVRTVSNFGQLGERPSHPELLDYLASRFVESGWSIKALHREIMLSATYALSAEHIARNFEKDPDNRLHWRANLIPRLDAESLRDSILAVSGALDPKIGGQPVELTDEKNHRRTVYATISRTKPDRTMAVFDFPDPNQTSEQRAVTLGPLQRLYFLNSAFIGRQSMVLAKRLEAEAGHDDAARIRRAYRLLFGRAPSDQEVALGMRFLQGGDVWPQYAQVLLASAEFSSVN